MMNFYIKNLTRNFIKMYKNKYIFFAIFVLFYSFFIHSQTINKNSDNINFTNIENLDRSWFCVLTGSPTSFPTKIETGFILIQEEKFLASYSENGKFYWQTNLNSKIIFYTVTETNFIYVINSKNQLILLNPSGLILWKIQLDFVPISSPVQGRDGRVFVQGKNTICCFGINSTQKWKLKTQNIKNQKLNVFNDGSILCILEKKVNNKSSSIRISPFGEILEEIIFQGDVINSFETEDGIILVFNNNQVGMCSIDFTNNLAYSKWINSDIYCNTESKLVKIKNSTYALFTPKNKLFIINSKTGKCENHFDIPEITDTILTFSYIDNKFFISNSNKFVIYYINGKCFKKFILPEKNGKYKWTSFLFLDTGYLTFLSEDWTLNAFKLNSTSQKQNFLPYKKNMCTYNQFIKLKEFKPNSSYFSDELISKLKNGNYSKNEISLMENMLTAVTYYIQKENLIAVNFDSSNLLTFDYTIVDYEKILNIIPLFESQIFSEKLAEILPIQKDTTLIIKTLQSISKCAYDPSGSLLLELERFIKKIPPTEKKVIEESLNALYEICKFMGRPAFFSKGKTIITNLFFPQYDESTKKYARVILQKLVDLQM